jgi:predicted PurR-regulated permease PerM
MISKEQFHRACFFTAVLITSVIVVQILKTLKGVFLPLAIAIFLTYLFSPPIEFLARYKVPRVLTLIVLVVAFCFAGYFGVQILMSNIDTLTERLPELQGEFINLIQPLLNSVGSLGYDRLIQVLQSSGFSELASSLFQKSLSVLGMILLTLLILVFLGVTYAHYPDILKKTLSGKRADEILKLVRRINRQIVRYVFVKSLISVGTGVFSGLTCFLLGIEFPILWGFLLFLFNFIPYFGSLLAVTLPIGLSILQFQQPLIPVLAVVTLIPIQVLMGSILEPHFMGNQFNLSPIVILISLFFWSYVWGLAGAFLAVPLTAIIRTIFINIDSLRPIAQLISRSGDT